MRNYYESLLEDAPLYLYFHKEHYVNGPHDDDELDRVTPLVHHNVRTLVCLFYDHSKISMVRSNIPYDLKNSSVGSLETTDLDPVITTDSIYSGEKFKHSFHAVFPSIEFSRTMGYSSRLLSMSPHFQSCKFWQGTNTKDETMSIIDTKVYPRNHYWHQGVPEEPLGFAWSNRGSSTTHRLRTRSYVSTLKNEST